MNPNRQIDDLLQELRVNELKYGYYILAVNLACIAYIIDRTDFILVNISDYLVFVSVISFSISFVLGLQFISIFNKVIELKINEIMVNDFSHEEYKKAHQISPNADSEGIKGIFLRNLNENSLIVTDRQKCLRKWIILLFSIGALAYFVLKIINGLQ